ncbi:hypothetical protein GHT06_015626 [Daphnia sinensis]|uniref:G-protein coupled receptors family 1 profile domain-containing protein n=1 Tax=Daphnia sinensis TaxID=1820382 RepID=A0AAD5KRG5_9CRUS|nr:hypothetical protein GHT06_015626 [Daphnia sinensis]
MGKPTNPLNATLNVYEFPLMMQTITATQEIYRTCIVAVGLFLNCVVILVVTSSQQLRYPRHIFWAAISLFECLFLVQCALELAVIVNQDRLACPVFVLMCSADYSLLLLCLLLAAFDRYLSIVRYEWYKKNVTVRNVIILISITSALTLVIVTIPFWTGYLSIYTYTLNLTHLHCVLAWDLFLGTVCVVLHFKIFVETKTVIRQYLPCYRHTPITVRFVTSPVRPSIASSGPRREASGERVLFTFPDMPSSVDGNASHLHSADAQLGLSIDGHGCFPWMHSGSKVSRLEVQAALNMSVNVLPFWLCTFPVSCYAIGLYWCIRLEGDCSIILRSWPYMWEFFLLHSIYNPVMYMLSSSEFQRAILHIIRKLINKCQLQAPGN